MEKIVCVYQITNMINNQKYIGSAVNFNRRKNEHLRKLRLNIHHSIKLQNSFNKYGEQNFQFIILETIPNVHDLINREQYYMDIVKPELNMTLIAGLNSHIGMKRSEETKNKIRNSQLGKTQSEETKQKIRNINLGKTQTLDTINKRVACQHKPVLQILNDGTQIEWDSPTMAAKTLNISRSVIYDCVAGRKKTYKQSKWIYKLIN